MEELKLTRGSATPLSGVSAALLVPRNEKHSVDIEAAVRLVRFLQQSGVRSFALNGATGEYTRSGAEDIRRLLEAIKPLLTTDDTLVLGAGGADSSHTQELLDLGAGADVDGYLLPVPYFFPLDQSDISAFVAGLNLHRPTYLYNLPSFTTPISPSTALEVCRDNPSLAGVKDSSGSLETVSLLTRELASLGRIIGNDGALHEALRLGLCDGVVSGVAGVLPELVQHLYTTSSRDATSQEAMLAKQALDDFILWLNRFPVPWGLKMTAEFRNIFPAEFPLRVSSERKRDGEEFMGWLEENRTRLMIDQIPCGAGVLKA